MFYNLSDFPYLHSIKHNIDNIKEEFNLAQKNNELVRSILNPNDNGLDYYTNYWVKDNGFHIEQIGYDIRNGQYATLSIYKKNYPNQLFDAEILFPKTLELIKSIPNVQYVGFFKMFAGTELEKHTHNRKHLIYHLLLNDLEHGDCILTCGNQQVSLQSRGDQALFDYSIEHGSSNNSITDRVHFIIDFNPF